MLLDNLCHADIGPLHPQAIRLQGCLDTGIDRQRGEVRFGGLHRADHLKVALGRRQLGVGHVDVGTGQLDVAIGDQFLGLLDLGLDTVEARVLVAEILDLPLEGLDVGIDRLLLDADLGLKLRIDGVRGSFRRGFQARHRSLMLADQQDGLVAMRARQAFAVTQRRQIGQRLPLALQRLVGLPGVGFQLGPIRHQLRLGVDQRLGILVALDLDGRRADQVFDLLPGGGDARLDRLDRDALQFGTPAMRAPGLRQLLAIVLVGQRLPIALQLGAGGLGMCPGGIPGELARRRLDQAPHLVDRAVTDIGVLAAEFCRQILLGDAEIGKATQELDTLLRRHGVVADHAG